MADRIDIVSGKHMISVECPHVEDGACSRCIAEQVVPYVSALATNEWILGLLPTFADGLRAEARNLERFAKAAEKMVKGARKVARAKWKLAGEATDGE